MKKLKVLVMAMSLCVGTTGFATSAMAEYGAIAFNQDTRDWGWASNYRTRRGAEDRALDECGRGCEIAVWYEDQCGAVAMGRDGGAGWAPGYDLAEAEDEALYQCEGVDRRCRILISSCSWD